MKTTSIIHGIFAVLAFGIFACSFGQAVPQLPLLNWQPQAGWINVKSAPYNAQGNGTVDDANAINAAFNALGNGGVVYLPAGTYRITKQLVMGTTGNKWGCQVLGTGRTTVIKWDGTTDSVMLHTRGAHSGEFNGITWDGNNKARIGIFHFSCGYMYEGQQRHENEAFINFSNGTGIRGANRADNNVCSGGFNPTAEMDIRNCLFSNCKFGIQSLYFNYFNWVVEGCEFQNCGTAVKTKDYGGLYVRFCHFENSTEMDLNMEFASSNSVRFCTSKGSKRFGWAQEMAIQDCSIDALAMNKDSALVLNSPRAPFLITDLYFTNWNSTKKPLYFTVVSPHDSAYAPAQLPQQLIYSNIQTDGTLLSSVISGGDGKALQTAIHGTTMRQSPLFPPEKSFFKSTVKMPCQGKVYRVNGTTGAAIQTAIDSARIEGNGATAYIPTGTYTVATPVTITGSNYFVTGTGSYTIIKTTLTSGSVFEVLNAQNVVIKNISLPADDPYNNSTGNRGFDCAGITIRGSTTSSSSLILDRVWAYGALPANKSVTNRDAYDMRRSGKGLVLSNLSPRDTVHNIRFIGALTADNSAEAIVVTNFSEAWPLIIQGTKPKTGFFGYLTRSHADTRVLNSNNLVVGDQYIEQVGACTGTTATITNSWILSGQAGDAAGRVTIGGVKYDHACTDTTVRIRNYSGAFFWSSWNLEGGQCQAGYPGSYRIVYSQTGDNPVWILLSGIQTGDQDWTDPCRWPFIFSVTSAAKVGLVQMKWIATDSYTGGDVNGGKKVYAAALDDFRMLGRWAYKLEYDPAYTWTTSAIGDTIAGSAGTADITMNVPRTTEKNSGVRTANILKANNSIVVEYNGLHRIDIFNAQGSCISSQAVNAGRHCIKSNTMLSGVYVVRVQTARGETTQKVVLTGK